MLLTLREAATLLGRSPRTLRGQAARGELPFRKQGGRWVIRRQDLPLTETQRAALLDRADEVREAVDAALPSRTAGKRWSVADNRAFVAGSQVLGALQDGPAATVLREGLLALAEGLHEYERGSKRRALEQARRCVARAVALLLLEGEHAAAVVRLEDEVIANIGGLLRRATR